MADFHFHELSSFTGGLVNLRGLRDEFPSEMKGSSCPPIQGSHAAALGTARMAPKRDPQELVSHDLLILVHLKLSS